MAAYPIGADGRSDVDGLSVWFGAGAGAHHRNPRRRSRCADNDRGGSCVMPWIRSSEIVPPLSSSEREEVADGRAVTRQTPEGVIVVNPRSVVTSYGIVTGVGVTFG